MWGNNVHFYVFDLLNLSPLVTTGYWFYVILCLDVSFHLVPGTHVSFGRPSRPRTEPPFTVVSDTVDVDGTARPQLWLPLHTSLFRRTVRLVPPSLRRLVLMSKVSWDIEWFRPCFQLLFKFRLYLLLSEAIKCFFHQFIKKTQGRIL